MIKDKAVQEHFFEVLSFMTSSLEVVHKLLKSSDTSMGGGIFTSLLASIKPVEEALEKVSLSGRAFVTSSTQESIKVKLENFQSLMY